MAPSGTPFGDYLTFDELGRGRFGVVVRALHTSSGTFVALKQMLAAEHSTPAERRAFLMGADIAARLEHPGIARVIEVGQVGNCPFFSMDLHATDLQKVLDTGQPSQARAARWMQQVATAVHHAHAREVLHHDLKPANILLDESGVSRVSDFGSAKRLSKDGECLESGGRLIGYYMAPEQASGEARDLTRRADIYSLGAILYEMLTGQVPYEQLSFADWISELVSDNPVRSPRELEPELNRDLELICLKCLEKDPNRRYELAGHLAEDLDFVLHGWRPRYARPESSLARVITWTRHHPLQSSVLAGVVLLGASLTITAASLRDSEKEQERSALETNAFIANSQAGALLSQLREFADRTERCAQRPSTRALLQAGEIREDGSALEACTRGFHAVYVSNPEGKLLSQSPLPVSVLGRNYEFRGYFRCSRELAQQGTPSACLGPAYLAESNGQLQIAFAAPVFGNNGEWIGSLVTGLTVDSAIGQVKMEDAPGSGRIVALLGPRDRDRSTPEPRRASFDFIVHPRLVQGQEVPLHEPSPATLDRAFGLAVTPGEQFSLRWAPPLLVPDYHDPLLEPGRSSLAAFAPVGRTGYVVVVQTSRDAVRRDGRALAAKLAWRVGAPLAFSLLLLGFALFSTVRRKRSLEAPRRAKRRGTTPVSAAPMLEEQTIDPSTRS
ncbi:MAG TPA: serine/threonine protein kinase [Polyangiaceae bacterium]|nr:serine/threonine protein kinase [Polyangiaceae bacterium]